MEGFYGVLFAVLSSVCLVLEWPRASLGTKPAQPLPAPFTHFRNNYLLVYSLMMGACHAAQPHAAQLRLLIRRARSPFPPAGDWLQGPYVYALYAAYGFNQGDIGKLFIAGFGSSMVFGTVVGSLADKQCVP